MCGIAALASADAPLPLEWVRRMTDLVRHRGPDGEGFATAFAGGAMPVAYAGLDTPPACVRPGHAYLPARMAETGTVAAEVLLAHRRLSIVDLSPAGHQPMSFANGRYWIVYNGEIYNHIELRVELMAEGVDFASSSDTEVILAAYHRWGPDCLARFNGMFAFVLYDNVEKKLFAARDRFGVKPLYYWIAPGGFVAFASEIKQFTALPGWQAQLNAQRGYDFLAWGLSEHTEETLFDGVRQLRGGEAVHFGFAEIRALRSGARLPVFRWYHLQPAQYGGNQAQAVEGFRELLFDAIRLRLRSDVPVGSCLSGGLDSSAIVCIAHQMLREGGASAGQRTFTAYAETGRFDERPFAREVIAQTGAEPAFVSPQPGELFARLDTVSWHMDEPFSSTSMFAQWKVFEAAGGAGVKVMLDGQGADEILGGYPVFWASRLAGLMRQGDIPGLIREVRDLEAVRRGTGRAAMRQMVPTLMPDGAFAVLRRLLGADIGRPDWLSTERLGARIEDPFASVAPGYRRSVKDLSLGQVLHVNLPMLLHCEDRNSMAHSVEARVPFLDYRLVELSLGMPDDLKLAGGWTKRILREATRGVLPEVVRQRRDKIGFETPELVWMSSHAELFSGRLDRAIAASQGIIRADHGRQLLGDMIAGRKPYSYLPWRMISFGAWIERFAVDCAPS